MRKPTLAGTEGTIRGILNALFSPLERISIFKSLDKPGSRGSIRLHLIVGLVVVTLLTCGIGGWASTAPRWPPAYCADAPPTIPRLSVTTMAPTRHCIACFIRALLARSVL